MFLNFIQDIEIGGEYLDKVLSYNFIYIRHDNEILNFKITINNMDVVDAIEDYIKTADTYSFKVMSEEHVKLLYKLRPSFFPNLGKFRLDNNIRKTNNYFVPEKTPLLEEFIDLLINKNFENAFIYKKLEPFLPLEVLKYYKYLIKNTRRIFNKKEYAQHLNYVYSLKK